MLLRERARGTTLSRECAPYTGAATQWRAETNSRKTREQTSMATTTQKVRVVFATTRPRGQNKRTLNPKNTGLGGALAGVGLEARTRPRKRAAPQHRSVRGVAQQRDNKDTLNPKP